MHCNLVEIDQQKCLEPAGRSGRHTHKLSYGPGTHFFPNTIKEWDSPPLNVVEAQSINSFLAQLNMLLFCYFILIISYYHY